MRWKINHRNRKICAQKEIKPYSHSLFNVPPITATKATKTLIDTGKTAVQGCNKV